MIAVEDGDEGRVNGLERGVDVSGLGVHVVGAGLVSDAGFKSELLKLLATAVVQDVDMQLVGGPVHVECAERGIAHHFQRLVIGGNQDVDMRPFLWIIGQRPPVLAAEARWSESSRGRGSRMHRISAASRHRMKNASSIPQ